MVINEKYCDDNDDDNENENENENKVVYMVGDQLKTINRDDSRFYDQRINGF